MRLKRWAWVPLLLALPALALSCGDNGAPAGPGPDRELTADERMLKSMILTADEVGEIMPGLAWIERESMSPFGGQEFIPDQERALGLVSAWQGVMFDEAEELGVPTDLYLYDTVDSAASALGKEKLPQLELEGAEIDGFGTGDIGDEAHGVITRPPGGRVFTGVFLRVDTVLAFISVGRSDDEDMSEEARRLAQKLAEKMEAALGA